MQKQKRRSGKNPQSKIFSDELAVKIDQALKFHQAGKLEKAKKLYQKVLKIQPDHNDALHMLGLIAHQSGNNDAAFRLYEKAIANNQHSAELFTNYGNALNASGQIKQAVKAFEKAININPDFALAHNNIGNVLAVDGKREEAIASFRKAIALAPGYAQAYFNLGNQLCETEKLGEAISCFRQAIVLQPGFVEALNNLAKLLMDKGDNAEAVVLLEQVLELDKTNGVAQHLLAALQGRTTAAAPESYVVGLFNGAANYFDHHLVDELGYKVPQFLQVAVNTALEGKNDPMDILDLGCGTGLCGPLFRQQAERLVGVDLAPNMIKQAEERNVYDQLITDDINSMLRQSKIAYDIILAADVFIYVGELKQIFEAMKNVLKANGLFAFSIESGNDHDHYTLLDTGRYAHSISYIRSLAAASGLREIINDEEVLRTDRGASIKGYIMVLKKE